MLWLDLAVVCLMMWGAVNGYQAGWRKALCRLGGLLCATLTALLSRKELICFGARHSPLERVIETMVESRLAIPVSGGHFGSAAASYSLDLPGVLWEALLAGQTQPVGGSPDYLVTLLVQLLGYTVAFLTGLTLWWGFFHLCSAALAGKEDGWLSKPSRWGGALIGLVRQFCCATLLIGIAVPLAWLLRIPSGLLQLEKTSLARWAWNFFLSLGVWY